MKKQVKILGEVAASGLRYQVGAEILRSVHITGGIAYNWVIFLKFVITQVILVSLLSHVGILFFFLFDALSAILLPF